MVNCNNCAWFCHTDEKCYGNLALLDGEEIGCNIDNTRSCRSWAFDGLKDWERENKDALVTVECVA